MMGGLTTVYDENGKVSFDDSRVFFGYEYMTLEEAVAFAIVDDATTGTLDDTEAIKLLDLVKRAAKEFGHQGYQYAHDFEGHFVDQEYVPTDKIYYEPTAEGYEEVIRKRIAHWNELQKAARRKRPGPPEAGPEGAPRG